MSQQGVIGFLDKAVGDTSVMDQMHELAHTSDDPATAIANYAAELGLEVTAREITEAVDALARIESGELSSEQLDAVAGGTGGLEQSLSMQYLQLQNNMQQENRQFTMMSNIMKTKHDTAKNAINNIR